MGTLQNSRVDSANLNVVAEISDAMLGNFGTVFAFVLQDHESHRLPNVVTAGRSLHERVVLDRGNQVPTVKGGAGYVLYLVLVKTLLEEG